MSKEDAVIDLLKHTLYIWRDDEISYEIYEGCTCNDYTGKHFLKYGISIQSKETMDAIGMDIQPHVVTLARAEPSDGGHYILFDMRKGTLQLVNFNKANNLDYEIQEFFKVLKEQFHRLEVIPLEPKEVQFCQPLNKEQERVPGIYRNYGWPTSEYRKKERVAEVKMHFDSFFED